MSSIPAAPTKKFNCGEQIINRAMRCKSEFQLEYIFLEMDHAIYNKVLEVLID